MSHLTSEQADALALGLVSGLGPRTVSALLDHFGSYSTIRQASAAQLNQVPRIGVKLSHQFAKALADADVETEIQRITQHGVRFVLRGEVGYPAPLAMLEDAPHLLYYRGGWSPADTNAVAIVGSRDCSTYGRRMTQQLATELVQAGYTVVSGLARGIDGEAHQAALRAGGRTLAVLAGGLSNIYPPEHRVLADEVAAQGAILSETPMTMTPQKGLFHARNRLISGLAQAVVVVEAGAKSGTLITVRYAAEQNRDVFAFPANADSPSSQGNLELLRNQGARMIRNASDLLEDLQGIMPRSETIPSASPSATRVPKTPPVPTATSATPPVKPVPSGLTPEQQQLWDLLREPMHQDELVRQLGRTVSEVNMDIMKLEMKRVIKRLPGNRFERE